MNLLSLNYFSIIIIKINGFNIVIIIPKKSKSLQINLKS